MMLIVLDKNPITAARKIPDGIRHKALLELMQMLSCVVGFGYHKIPQGKRIKEWISNNKVWVWNYATTMYFDYIVYSKPKEETIIKYKCLLDLLKCQWWNQQEYKKPATAIFRYVKEYKGTSYPTDSALPIDIAVEEYQKYLNFKKQQRIKSYY